ncbi:perilipin-4 [Sturnira hondurensis]|uniref:perilipin-4 n=1 Tax=Sturnira hondurensis TaxID=192404 RepID=UPI001879A85B|nr:perilipin-4 [Sturnira hondurensis]
MSAQGEGGREPKPKGKILGSFLGFLPGFSSARNLVANAQGPAKEVQPVTDPSGTTTPQATHPRAQAATSPKQTAREVEMMPPPSDKMISGAKDLVCSTMTKTKDAISSGVANVMDSAKDVVQGGLGMTQPVLTGTKEAVASGVTGAVGVAKGAIQTGMETTKTVLTGTKDAVSTGLTGAMGVAKGAVQTGMDTTKTVLTGTKDAMSTGLTGAMGMAKGTVQTGMDTTKTVLTGTKDAVSTGLTGAMAVAKGAVQTGAGTVQNWLPGAEESSSSGFINSRDLDKCGEESILNSEEAQSCRVSSLPDTPYVGQDLAREATTDSHGLVSTVVTFTQGAGLGKEKAGCIATARSHEGVTGFTTLSDELEELGEIFHPMNAEEQAQLVASEPGPRVPAGDQRSYFVRLGDLAHGFRQRAFEHAMSHLQHGQFQARATLALLEDSFSMIEKAKQAPEGQPWPDPGPKGRVEKASAQEEGPDAEALSRTCGLMQQLHVAYSTLASGLQGLPAELQQRVRQARHSLCELYGIVSSASSITELPAERLAQSRESVGQAWQGLEKLLESVQHSPPLSWLVGPFDLHPGGQ